MGKRAITKILPRGVVTDKTLLWSIDDFSHGDSDLPHRESSLHTKKEKYVTASSFKILQITTYLHASHLGSFLEVV